MTRYGTFLVALALGTIASASSAPASEKLLGVWRIESFYTEVRATGERVHAFGDQPKGYLVFTPEKRMVVVVTAPNRKKPQNDEDRAAAYRSMNASAGVYRVEGDKYIIKYEAAWNEDIVGSEQARSFVVEGDTLTITTDWGPSGILPGKPETRGVSVYRRVSAN